jgi:hypothetical protein
MTTNSITTLSIMSNDAQMLTLSVVMFMALMLLVIVESIMQSVTIESITLSVIM